jgi:hypothetical protein
LVGIIAMGGGAVNVGCIVPSDALTFLHKMEFIFPVVLRRDWKRYFCRTPRPINARTTSRTTALMPMGTAGLSASLPCACGCLEAFVSAVVMGVLLAGVAACPLVAEGLGALVAVGLGAAVLAAGAAAAPAACPWDVVVWVGALVGCDDGALVARGAAVAAAVGLAAAVVGWTFVAEVVGTAALLEPGVPVLLTVGMTIGVGVDGDSMCRVPATAV